MTGPLNSLRCLRHVQSVSRLRREEEGCFSRRWLTLCVLSWLQRQECAIHSRTSVCHPLLWSHHWTASRPSGHLKDYPQDQLSEITDPPLIDGHKLPDDQETRDLQGIQGWSTLLLPKNYSNKFLSRYWLEVTLPIYSRSSTPESTGG